MNIKQVKQIFKFGIVGGVSTLVSSATFLLLADSFKITPLLANFLAFLFAFSISYLGHSRWTFENQQHSREKLIKFLMVSLLGLTINSFFVWLLMHLLHQPAFVTILPMIFLTPLFVFFVNKVWIFSE